MQLVQSITLINCTIIGAIQDIKPAMTLEEALEGAFEQLRELMRNGDPANGIPVLAPFFEAHLPLDVDLSGLIEYVQTIRKRY